MMEIAPHHLGVAACVAICNIAVLVGADVGELTPPKEKFLPCARAKRENAWMIRELGGLGDKGVSKFWEGGAWVGGMEASI